MIIPDNDIFYIYYIGDSLLEYSSVFGYPHMNDKNIKFVGMKSNDIFKKRFINDLARFSGDMLAENLYKISQGIL